MFIAKRFISVIGLALALAAVAAADEGLWLVNHPPTEQVKAKYGFVLNPEWLSRTQLSSVRFVKGVSGASGSFVSATGLTLTNHHVARACLYGLSSKDRDFYASGFYAETQTQEAKCPGYEVNAVVGIEEVTAKVNVDVTPDTYKRRSNTRPHHAALAG
jgi:hypothetical protein